MVLAELGASITSALSKATKSNVDSALLDEILKDIATALLSADVNVRLVATLRANVKKRVNLEEIGTGLKVERVINEAVFKELVAILDPGVPKKNPTRGKQNVVLFVGLQGAGKVGPHMDRSRQPTPCLLFLSADLCPLSAVRRLVCRAVSHRSPMLRNGGLTLPTALPPNHTFQDDICSQVRALLQEKRLQASTRLRRHVPRGSPGSVEAKRHQGANTVLWFVPRNGPGNHRCQWCETIPGRTAGSDHC
mmetsp:Transcript_14233/g.40633  ORF Transcript_14233/g.40633 Transcript_14233/m.40633 type:complete len:250 (+) Transcript_14233:1034-1783(+)